MRMVCSADGSQVSLSFVFQDESILHRVLAE